VGRKEEYRGKRKARADDPSRLESCFSPRFLAAIQQPSFNRDFSNRYRSPVTDFAMRNTRLLRETMQLYDVNSIKKLNVTDTYRSDRIDESRLNRESDMFQYFPK